MIPLELLCNFCGLLVTRTIHTDRDAEYLCEGCGAAYLVSHKGESKGVTRLHIKGTLRKVAPLPKCENPSRCSLFKYPNKGARGTLEQTDCKFTEHGETCSHPRRV